MMKISYNVIALWMICIALGGCEHKELCIDHPHGVPVHVETDWSQLSDLPVNMTLLFYPQNGDEAIHVHNYNPYSAKAKLPVNTYDVVVFNELIDGLGGVGYRNMGKFEAAEFYLRESTWQRRIKSTSEGGIVAEPERVGVGTIRDFEITEEMLAKYRGQKKQGQPTDEPVLAVTPENIVYEIEVTIPVEGLNYVRSMECTISGMAGGYKIREGETSTDRVVHALSNWSKAIDDEQSKGVITGRCLSFGLPSDHTGEPGQNILKLSALLVDNETVVDFAFEVGQYFSNEQSGKFPINLDLEVVFPEVEFEEEMDNAITIDPDFDGDHWVEWRPN